MAIATIESVLSFWFEEARAEAWYKKNAAFDRDLTARFRATYDAASAGSLEHWAASVEGALALCIVLDQFPRNMFRENPQAFATDVMARQCAEAALARGFDQGVPPLRRQFFYLPFMHSERLADQERCVALCQALAGVESQKTQKAAVAHRDIVARFGRFPHRNAVLGRGSSNEEIAFLKEPGSSF